MFYSFIMLGTNFFESFPCLSYEFFIKPMFSKSSSLEFFDCIDILGPYFNDNFFEILLFCDLLSLK